MSLGFIDIVLGVRADWGLYYHHDDDLTFAREHPPDSDPR